MVISSPFELTTSSVNTIPDMSFFLNLIQLGGKPYASVAYVAPCLASWLSVWRMDSQLSKTPASLSPPAASTVPARTLKASQ